MELDSNLQESKYPRNRTNKIKERTPTNSTYSIWHLNNKLTCKTGRMRLVVAFVPTTHHSTQSLANMGPLKSRDNRFTKRYRISKWQEQCLTTMMETEAVSLEVSRFMRRS
jgi:hypothetical protein